MANYRLSNTEVVSILEEALAAMEIKNVNQFRIRAYQNAIAVLDNLTSSIYDIWENNNLDQIPGLGSSLTAHLNELFTTGNVKEFNELKKGLPQGMFSLIGLRGIGAKKAFKLAFAFGLNDRETAVKNLKLLASKEKIRLLEGFGEKSEKDILEAIEQLKMTKNEKPRMLLIKAEQIVDRILEHMKKCSEVIKIDALGSYRRRNDTIGDLDIVVATNNPQEVLEHFIKFPEISEILVKGDKKITVNLTNDVQVDIRVSTPQAYGSMLQYSTGSKQHNVLLRTFALEKGMSLSEYGIKIKGKITEYDTEEKFYKKLDLQWIPPELRNGTNEIELSANYKLPKLVELKDIKGDIHTHTTYSDGINSHEEMLSFAQNLGYEYIGISDHAPSVQSRSYKEVEDIVGRTRVLINKLKKSHPEINILFGYEVNILADATLSLPDSILKSLDYVIASIHTSFNQNRDEITQRLLNAIENPYVNIIGHPSGRLINERDPIDPDWKKVFQAAVDHDKVLEINSQPNRLDLTFDLVRQAINKDIKLIINTDAHATDQLFYMKYGVDVARRAGAEKSNISNTLSFDKFCKTISARN